MRLAKKIAFLSKLFIFLLFILYSCETNHTNIAKKVLFIYDFDITNPNTVALRNALTVTGYNVKYSSVAETEWDNTNPPLTGFYAVIHLNGNFYDTEMPLAGQEAIVDFVKNRSGKYVSSGINALEIAEGRMLAMQDLILCDTAGLWVGNTTYTMVDAQANHPVLKTVPATFPIDSIVTKSRLHAFNENPSVVLFTEGERDAVFVREVGTGKVLGFHHWGNYNGSSHWSNPNIQKIVVNFLNWE